MTRTKFTQNLIKAIENKDQYVSEENINKFLDLNYDEDGDWDWDYDNFTQFASDLCANFGDFWQTVEDYDLHTPVEYENEENI